MGMDEIYRNAAKLAEAINAVTNLNKNSGYNFTVDIEGLEVEPLDNGFAKVSFVYSVK